MVTIESLLHRRTDLSTFVVHFTRDTEVAARDNLTSILKNRQLCARSVYGMAKDLAARFAEVAETQRVVCFTETTLEHAWMMCADIDGRDFRYNGYGLAFTKTFARHKSVNPVWYIDQTPGHDWLTGPINNLIRNAETTAIPGDELEPDPRELAKAEVLRLAPFFEQMGPTNLGGRKEFWWEREWRHVGDMRFSHHDVVVVFAPEDEHDAMRSALGWDQLDISYPTVVDASWGLERMIGALARLEKIGPFPV